MKIGVGITTHNRRHVYSHTLTQWQKHLPAGAALVVVDDASDQPAPSIGGATVVHHEYRRGVAMAKNRCITELIDAGCDHLFLADDDIWPIQGNWWQPYVESPEPHLMYGWDGSHTRQRHKNPNWPPRITDGDDHHDAYSFPRGVLLYLERKAINVVGGMNTAHGIFSGEHVEYSQRIHEAGLTRWPFADVRGADQLWYARDKEDGNTTGSSFTLTERRRLHKANGVHWGRKWPNWPWFPYREGEGVQDYSLGPRLTNTYEGTLDHVLGCHPHGTALEFGVGTGGSLRRIATEMPAIGFDSFDGLPEDWREGFPAGMFACEPPDVPNASLVPGLFSDTLPSTNWQNIGPIGLVHIDCDLHSSTMTVLNHIGPLLNPGTYIVFDEWHGYDGHENHEMRAWQEFADRTGIGWTVIGHGPEQWAIRIV